MTLTYSRFVSAKLKCPVSAKLKWPNYPSVRWRRRRLGVLTMSGNELQCIEFLPEVLARRRHVASTILLWRNSKFSGGGQTLLAGVPEHVINDSGLRAIRSLKYFCL